MHRLETLWPEIATQLRQGTTAQQRAASLAACRYALATANIQNAAVTESLEIHLSGNVLSPDLQKRVESLASELDCEYLDGQDANADTTKFTNHLRLFSEARAVSALAFLGRTINSDTWADVVYEAAMAMGDRKLMLKATIQSQLKKIKLEGK